MKKTSKIVSLLLTLVMMLGIAIPVSADSIAFSDVPASHGYYDAIMNLAAEGILNGMGDGTFAPEGDVTRAQFAKIICFSLSLGNITYSDAEKKIFTDVAPEHWAANNIKTAYDLKIINGMGDGTFAPENNVLYEQAVKMAVCALGYTEVQANRQGGYPMGYMAIANKAGLLKGITDAKQGQPMKRGSVAQLVDNMLDADQIIDGEAAGSLREDVGTTKKVEGQLIGAYRVSLYTGALASTCGRTQIEFEFGSERMILDAENLNIDIDSFLGRSVIVYYEEESGYDIPVATNIALQTKKNAQVVINLDTIKDYGTNYVEYYTSESGDDFEKVRYDSADIMFNGQASTSSLKDLLDANITNAGTLTLVYSEDDSVADVAFLKAYETVVVSSVDTRSYTVYPKGTSLHPSYVLDTTDRNKTVTIKNNGKAYEFSRLRANNVLSIAMSADQSIIDVMVSTKTVSGTVEYNDGNSVKLDVGNVTYNIANNLSAAERLNLQAGSYVTIYIDSFSRIARVVASVKGSYTYGYLSQIELPEGRDGAFYVMVYKLGKSNSTLSATNSVYTLSKKVKIDGTNYDSIEDANTIKGILESAAAATNVNATINGTAPTGATVSQPVRFLADGNVIEGIITNQASTGSTNTELRLKHYVTGSGIQCMVEKSILGEYKISSSTTFIYVPSDRATGTYTTKSSSFFKESENYYVQLAGVTSSNSIGAIYIYGTTMGGGTGTAGISEDSKPMIVKAKSDVLVNSVPTKKFTLIDASTGAEVVIYDDNRAGTEGLATLVEGDVIRVAYEEVVYDDVTYKMTTALQVVAVATEVANGTKTAPYEVVDGGSGRTADFRTLIGVVRTKDTASFVLVPGTNVSATDVVAEPHNYLSTANVYLVDTAEDANNRVKTALYGEVVDNDQPGNNSKVLIYTEKDTLKCIIIFK